MRVMQATEEAGEGRGKREERRTTL